MGSRLTSFGIAVFCFVIAACTATGCSVAADPPPDDDPSGNTPAPAPTGVPGRDASAPVTTGGPPIFAPFEGGARATSITPENASLEVDPSSGAKGTIEFKLNGAVDHTPVWSVGNTSVGSVDQTGHFVANGSVGGETDVTVKVGDRTIVAHVTVVIRYRENGANADTIPAGGGAAAGGGGGVGGDGAGGPVAIGVMSALDGVPTLEPAMALLYPYDGTVFPLGVLPPLLQWKGGGRGPFDAVRIHVEVPSYFYYDGYFARPASLAATNSFLRHPIPDRVWTNATATAAGGTLKVSVTLAAGLTAFGPLEQSYRIAAGKISGKVYYQAYNTELAKNYDGAMGGGRFGGATLSIAIGAQGPSLVAGKTSSDTTGCRVCHSVSAYGDRMLVQRGNDTSATSLYELRNGNAESDPYASKQFGRGFAGIHPNGQLALSNSVNVQGSSADSDNAALYDVATGAAIATTGLTDFATKLALPMFSPDGKHVAFTLFDGPSNLSVGPPTGRQLVVMDFDVGTKTFSNPRKLWETTAANQRPAWPTFFPSGTGVVFMRHIEGTDGETFASRYGARGDLQWTDIATGITSPLSALNGTGYLPSGANAHDADDTLQYEPTISPVASGGYAWIVFMSRRLYGNVATIDPFWSDPREHDLVNQVTPKKLWMAAIDLDPKPGTDPSHPAFYIPGQELYGSNSRPFFALDPCIDDGGTCTSGVDCCGGYCINGLCRPPPKGCSATGNRCTSASDCCDNSDSCVNSVCSLVLH